MLLDQMQLPPGIKIAVYASVEPQPEELDYLRALGVEYVTTWAKPHKATPDYYVSRKQIFANAGITLYGMGNIGVHNPEAIVLNLPERDAKIEVYRQHLRNLAAAGIPYTTYAHMANGIWSTARETSRLLLVYFYISHFVLMFGFHTGLRIARKMRYQEGQPEPASLTGYQRAIKRTIDVAAAGLGLIAIAPIMIAIAIAIKLDSQGPVFFRQQRVGENKRMFGMYKFRSMFTDAEQRLSEVIRHTTDGHVLHKQPNDPRVTRIGRFIRRTSLDELPQLLNVIFGDMSLVGPRPELPMLVAKYEPWQHERLCVPQGMTGWWQVNGRADKHMHLNTQEDIYYVRNYSLMLDLQIILKTVWVVLRGKGAY